MVRRPWDTTAGCPFTPALLVLLLVIYAGRSLVSSWARGLVGLWVHDGTMAHTVRVSFVCACVCVIQFVVAIVVLLVIVARR